MDSLSFTAPIDQKFTATTLETALAKAVKTTFEQKLHQKMQDLLDYGTPHLGSRTVVERFTKQDGLVVLRRPVVSDTIMRVILANWLSLGSERGLGFLRFVLTMLWEKEWSIVRLWHSSVKAEEYPRFLSQTYVSGYFLTSRIHLNIKASVDLSEISELTPIIRQLVPANIVVSVIAEALNRDFEKNIEVAMVGKVYQIQDLSRDVRYSNSS